MLVLQEQHRRLFLRLLPAPLPVFHDHVALQKNMSFLGDGVCLVKSSVKQNSVRSVRQLISDNKGSECQRC